MNSRNRKCAAGHPMTYNHGVGGYRCEWGALHTAGGREVHACQ